MKFEYNGNTVEPKPVAAIHRSDAILLQVDSGVLAIGTGGGAFHEGETLDFWESTITHKFYPGDKITITF